MPVTSRSDISMLKQSIDEINNSKHVCGSTESYRNFGIKCMHICLFKYQDPFTFQEK